MLRLYDCQRTSDASSGAGWLAPASGLSGIRWDSTITLIVFRMNGSERIRSSTSSKCSTSRARTCSNASAPPVTVIAAVISGWLRTTSASRLGGAAPSQYTSTYASVRQPSADGCTVAVNPVITSVSRNRSTRRLTAVADRPTAAPISAKLVLALAISAVMIFRSRSSNCVGLLLMAALYPAGTSTPAHVQAYELLLDSGFMLRALAVDDERPSLEELLYLLHADPRIGSAEGASDATEALRRINRALESGPHGPEAIDVVFLDINMPGLDGLDLARLLTGFARPPLVVFVTAHEDFAVQAFDLKAVDYVLKPVRKERLAEAVRRAAELRDSAPRIPVSEPDPDHIPVELGGVTRFVAVEDITHVEAQGDYARLHTDKGSHLVRIPLSTLEERWRSRGFVRIHRRHLVALRHIGELRLDAGTVSVMVGSEELQVSRRHTRELRDLLMRRP